MERVTTDLRVRESLAARRRSEGKFAEAEQLYTAAAELAADPEHAAQLWNNAGLCALKVYDTDRAVRCFRSALEAATQIPGGDAGRLRRLYANLTAAYYEGARMREAWNAAHQALLLAEGAGDPKAAGHALYNLGLAERYLGEFAEAAKLFAAARRQYLEAGERSLAADALHNIGWVLLDREDLAAAERALLEARAEKAALGEPVARIEVELGRLAYKRGDWLAALASAVEIAESAEAIVDPVTRLQALALAAEAAAHDDLDAALHYVTEAVGLALSLGRPPLLLDLMPIVIRLRAEAGQPVAEAERMLAQEMYERRHGVHGQLVQTPVSLN